MNRVLALLAFVCGSGAAVVACSSNDVSSGPTSDAGPNATGDGSSSSSTPNGQVQGCGDRRGQDKSCRVNDDCCSLRCAFPPAGGGGGRCALGRYGDPCGEGSTCADGECIDGVCKAAEVGEACETTSQCYSDVCTNGSCACNPELGGRCRTPNDCCDGLTCSSGSCRHAKGASCFGDDDCVGYSCTGGTCACSERTRACSTDADCCSGACTNGVCASPAGAACTAGIATCLVTDRDDLGTSGCVDGTCVCGRIGSACGVDTDCCSGECMKYGPSYVGECTEALPGDSCTFAIDCAYSPETYGHPACGGDGKCACSPKKGVCHEDKHCCSGPCEDGLCTSGPEPSKCITLNQASETGNDCCLGLVAPGGPGTACCGASGRSCTESYQCCTNTCGVDGKCP